MIRLACLRADCRSPIAGRRRISARVVCPLPASGALGASQRPALRRVPASRRSPRIEAKTREDRLVLLLDGELDISSEPLLEEQLTEACTKTAEDIVIDLTGVEFIDSIGVSALLRGQAFCEEHTCTAAQSVSSTCGSCRPDG